MGKKKVRKDKRVTEGQYEKIVKSVVMPQWVHEFDEGPIPAKLISYSEVLRGFIVTDTEAIMNPYQKRQLGKVLADAADSPAVRRNRRKNKKGEGPVEAPVSVSDGVESVEGVVGCAKVYPTVTAAYDSVDCMTFETILDSSLEGRGGSFSGGRVGGWMYFCDKEDDRLGVRGLMSTREDLGYSVVAYSYHEWVTNIAPAYHKDPGDWVNAYNFINFHPAFWRRYEYAANRGYRAAYDWETDLGCDWVTVYVSTDGGKRRVYMDTGAHVESDGYRSRYADMRLHVSASNFEKAYVKLARAVAKAYTDDGYDRDEKKS